QIDSFVVPIEERSLDAYENGWKKATDLGIYNQWTQKMRDALGRLNGELYPPMKEIGFDIRSSGPAAMPALLDAPKRGGPNAAPSGSGGGNANVTPAAPGPAAPAPAPPPSKKGGKK